MLISDFSYAEIKEAVWDCGGDKSPGPDGFNFQFIRECWDIIKGDVERFVKEFHRNSKLAKGLNSSFLTLIPKRQNPFAIEEYRPISLIGCAYKVLSKVLANRLSKILDELISANQSAFIGNRNILDDRNILVANEIVDEVRKDKRQMFILKIDFEKAYDSVSWDFLWEMMVFDSKWCNWIKTCVESTRISILVNGSPTKEFKAEKGVYAR